VTLIASWHPAYALWTNPFEMGAFVIDLDRFSRLIHGKLEAPPKEVIPKARAKDVKRLHRWALKTGEPLAVDIETAPNQPGDKHRHTGKDPTRCCLRMVGVGNCDVGLAHVWKNKPLKIQKAIKELMEDERVTKILHNGHWFDLRVFERYGIKSRNVQDTRDARRALSSTSPLKLSYCTSLYADAHPWKENEEDDEKGLVHTKDLKKLAVYNCYDVIYTARVDRGITSESDWNTPRVRRLYEVHEGLAVLAAEMHTVGIRVDKRMRQFMAWALLQEYEEKEKKLLKTVALKDFACNPNHMRALIWKRHATGKYAHLARFNLEDPIDPAYYVDPKEMVTLAVDEDALTLLLIDPDVPEELKGIIQLYWDAQEIWKKRSTFVASKLVSRAIGTDGRIRPGWNSCGTDTGRFACREPNLMNIEKMLRAMYVASKGHRLVGADRSQFELRIMYAVTGDEALGAALASGDVYTEDAKDFFSLPPETTKHTVKKEARKSAKIIHLGKQYAAGKKTVFQQALKQDKTFKWELNNMLCDSFDRRYCRTVEWWHEELDRVLATSYSETRILNRRRVYPRPPAITDTSNYPIQGTAGDIKSLWQLEVRRLLRKHCPGAHLVIDLHDFLGIDSPQKYVGDCKRILEDTANKEWEIGGRKHIFPADAEAHFRWSDFS
jgi:DNA polymerase I-like protein with 3'-5' exonuclease and polymerase domains